MSSTFAHTPHLHLGVRICTLRTDVTGIFRDCRDVDIVPLWKDIGQGDSNACDSEEELDPGTVQPSLVPPLLLGLDEDEADSGR